MTKTKPDTMLWLSDARGQYIPRDFANSFADRAKHVSGVSAETWAILEQGPEAESYWDAWQEVCDNAVITDENGVKFFVDQDGDCWLVPVGMVWDEDNSGGWIWPNENEESES